nr:hypothetical protein Iba_chr02bCG1670 [Ipomoea batatas]GMC62221.1 hypothetical protein Iba_chr02cCG1810 [Ipomoea batatas]
MQSATREEALMMRRLAAITHSAIAIFVLITITRRRRFLAVCPNLKDLLGRPFSGRKRCVGSVTRFLLLTDVASVVGFSIFSAKRSPHSSSNEMTPSLQTLSILMTSSSTPSFCSNANTNSRLVSTSAISGRSCGCLRKHLPAISTNTFKQVRETCPARVLSTMSFTFPFLM